MKCGALTISALALLWLLATPAAAQWGYYNGYQAYPPAAQPAQPDYSAYPPFPGGESDRGASPPPAPDYAYGQPSSGPPAYGQPGYGEPQPAPPGQGTSPPTNQPAGSAYPESVYNPPPDDAVAAASAKTERIVAYPTTESPGTIIIDTNSRHLYLIQGGGQAIEYGIGVGREGFAWHGVARVGAKQEWPKWFPPEAMLQRRPDLPIEMDGGLGNPLGARAMYLYEGKTDTQYRIHGTNEPDTIGKAVSSGCIRMMNADVMDLYNRVPIGTKVIVL